MAHWKQIIEGKYIGAYCLDGKDLIVIIESIGKEEVKTEQTKDCLVAHLKGQKPMIINSTNCKVLTKLFDSPNVEDWINKPFTVFPTKVRAFGETVEALRIRPTLPKIELPELTPTHKKWQGAKDAILSGNATIADIEKKYTISPENKVLLCEK